MKDKMIFEFQSLQRDIYFLKQLIQVFDDSIQYNQTESGNLRSFDCISKIIKSKINKIDFNFEKLFEKYIKNHII